MGLIRLRERLERIEAAYLAALAGRDPETVLPSVWRSEILPAILTAVPDADVVEITAMFNWRKRKADRKWREFRKRNRLSQSPNWP